MRTAADKEKKAMKIVLLDGYTLNPGDLSWEPLKMLGDVRIYDRTAPEQVIERIGDAEIVLTNKIPITEEIIRKTNIRYIGVLATGYNIIDTDAAKKAGIPVTNIPAYGTGAVAQFAAALLLELCHHVGAHSESVYKGQWQNSMDWCYWNFPLIELAGKTLGIIGFGKIGQAFGKIGAALGMNVIYYSRHPAENCAFAQPVEFEDLLACSDVISLHCPLFDSTRELINRSSISKMKTGVMLLNTARGALIAEKDLADALISGKIAGAALDVVSAEPIQPDNPLLEAPNCILTPHIAWAAKEPRQRLLDIVCSNIAAFQAGTPVNTVN